MNARELRALLYVLDKDFGLLNIDEIARTDAQFLLDGSYLEADPNCGCHWQTSKLTSKGLAVCAAALNAANTCYVPDDLQQFGTKGEEH